VRQSNPENFKKIVDWKDYLPQQSLYLDETGLLWKKCQYIYSYPKMQRHHILKSQRIVLAFICVVMPQRDGSGTGLSLGTSDFPC